MAKLLLQYTSNYVGFEEDIGGVTEEIVACGSFDNATIQWAPDMQPQRNLVKMDLLA